MGRKKFYESIEAMKTDLDAYLDADLAASAAVFTIRSALAGRGPRRMVTSMFAVVHHHRTTIASREPGTHK